MIKVISMHKKFPNHLKNFNDIKKLPWHSLVFSDQVKNGYFHPDFPRPYKPCKICPGVDFWTKLSKWIKYVEFIQLSRDAYYRPVRNEQNSGEGLAIYYEMFGRLGVILKVPTFGGESGPATRVLASIGGRWFSCKRTCAIIYFHNFITTK